jgi:hypothetical protein
VADEQGRKVRVRVRRAEPRVGELAVLALAVLLTVLPTLTHQPRPIAILWHTATPIVDWTPHTSSVLVP